MKRSYIPIPIPTDTVECVTQTEAGDDLAPEERICDVPEDCVHCADKGTCKDYESPEEP